MVILSAIGRFFARIGRWIRDTAWVQPLLIVGGIFAIIFSIPYITQWVNSWFDSANAAQSFFSEYKVSLKDSENSNSDADKLFNYLLNYQKDSDDAKKYGNKFFIMLTEEDCAGCTTTYEGLKYLRDNWNKSEFVTEGQDEFKLYSLFVDTTNDDDENLFKKYFYNTYDVNFEEVAGNMPLSPYYTNQGGAGSTYASNIDSLSDPNSMSVPTLFLVDLDYECAQQNQLGITEIIFTLETKNSQGSNALGRARTLFDCWNHTDIFSTDYNKD